MRARTSRIATTSTGTSTRWLGRRAGKVRIDYRPVHMYTLSSDVDVVPPKRVY
jgi:predicted transcriptional regulator